MFLWRGRTSRVAWTELHGIGGILDPRLAHATDKVLPHEDIKLMRLAVAGIVVCPATMRAERNLRPDDAPPREHVLKCPFLIPSPADGAFEYHPEKNVPVLTKLLHFRLDIHVLHAKYACVVRPAEVAAGAAGTDAKNLRQPDRKQRPGGDQTHNGTTRRSQGIFRGLLEAADVDDKRNNDEKRRKVHQHAGKNHKRRPRQLSARSRLRERMGKSNYVAVIDDLRNRPECGGNKARAHGIKQALPHSSTEKRDGHIRRPEARHSKQRAQGHGEHPPCQNRKQPSQCDDEEQYLHDADSRRHRKPKQPDDFRQKEIDADECHE